MQGCQVNSCKLLCRHAQFTSLKTETCDMLGGRLGMPTSPIMLAYITSTYTLQSLQYLFTLPIALHINPHCRLCSLIRNTPPASAPHFLRGALFHLQLLPEPERKRAPRPYVFYFPFLPLIGVAAMSTSPHNINRCPMLPHRCLLHAKSLSGPTLRAPPKSEAGFRPLPSQVYGIAYPLSSSNVVVVVVTSVGRDVSGSGMLSSFSCSPSQTSIAARGPPCQVCGHPPAAQRPSPLRSLGGLRDLIRRPSGGRKGGQTGWQEAVWGHRHGVFVFRTQKHHHWVYLRFVLQSRALRTCFSQIERKERVR